MLDGALFFWRRLRRAKRQTQPARGTHRRQPPGRVPVWFRVWCVICWRHCHAPSSTTHAPMFLVHTCRSKVVSVRTPKLAIPGPQSAPCAGLKCQIPLEMQHKEGTGAPGSACGAPQAPAARAGLVRLWHALLGGACFLSAKPLGGGRGGLKLFSTHRNTGLLDSTHRQEPQSATLRCSRPSARHLDGRFLSPPAPPGGRWARSA